MSNQTVYPYGQDGQLPSGYPIADDLNTDSAQQALSARQGKIVGDVLFGEPQQETSLWGTWTGAGTPTRAMCIAVSKTVLNGIVTFKLSSYSTYKIDVAFKVGTTWESEGVYDSGWQTDDIVKTVASGEDGYYVRVAVGRIDNQAITTTEFLSVISELEYEYSLPDSTGLVTRVASLEGQVDGSIAMINIIPDYIVSGESVIDLDSIPVANGIIGIVSGSIVWTAIDIGRHKAIPVVAGEKYVINGDGNGFWAWLSSSYSPPLVSGESVQFADGNANRVYQKDAIAVTVPVGVAFLYISTVNGSGASSSWQIWKVSGYKRRTADAATLRVLHWNIGGFVYADWEVGTQTRVIPSSEAAEYAQRYKSLIDSVAADICAIAEYDPSFSAAQWVTKDVIFQNFRTIFEGTKSGANCNTVMLNVFEYVGAEQIAFTIRQENRYYTHVTARFKGENIHIVEAHLDHTYDEKRVAQIAQLISDMSPYKYVIIGGDFNTGNEETVESEFGAFKTAGYTMLNDDYLGLVVTSLTEEYVDNIIVKGFTMSNRQTSEVSGTLSDHLLISCDLTMQHL